MKIGIVLYPTFGGSGVVATELGIKLAEIGYEIHFISYSQPARLQGLMKNIFYHEVKVSEYPLFDYPPYELVLSSTLVDVVKRENLDLLHVHYAIPHASAAYMAKHILMSEGIDIPYITTLHGTDITLVGKDPSFESVITFAINQSDAVTAVSDSLKKDTFKFFHVDREVEMIPNFIKLSEYEKVDTSIRDQFAKPEERIICHISNFRKVKRVEDVIKVFKGINDKIPSKLLLVGDGPERSKIQELCTALGVCHLVTYLGKLPSTIGVLAISDLFLLPSETESFGLVALEAMASRVPVISSNTGGIPEVNIHGVSGYLSDVGNVDEMAANGIKILESDETLSQFKEQAYAVAKTFDLDELLPKYIELYNRFLK
jgi:N-acetyl-alpha-D-glucosaminyl L-malate synthase BshA